jgi:hypothetical protein
MAISNWSSFPGRDIPGMVISEEEIAYVNRMKVCMENIVTVLEFVTTLARDAHQHHSLWRYPIRHTPTSQNRWHPRRSFFHHDIDSWQTYRLDPSNPDDHNEISRLVMNFMAGAPMDISPDFVTSFVTPNAPQPEHQSDAEDASDVRSLFEHSWVFTPIRWDSLIAKASIDGLEYTNIFQIVFNTHLPRLMWKVFCWCLQFYYSYTPNYCVMADLYRYQVCEVAVQRHCSSLW